MNKHTHADILTVTFWEGTWCCVCGLAIQTRGALRIITTFAPPQKEGVREKALMANKKPQLLPV